MASLSRITSYNVCYTKLLRAAIVSLSTVVFSVFAAIFVTLGLDPLVRFFQRRGMTRGWAILTVIILFVLVQCQKELVGPASKVFVSYNFV